MFLQMVYVHRNFAYKRIHACRHTLVFRKNQNGFRRNRSTTSQILTIRIIFEGVREKKPTSDITICRLCEGLRFHTQREDGTNPTSIPTTKRNSSSNNDSLQKHQSESAFTRWRHRILRHCCRSTTRGHASPISSVYTRYLELRSTKSEKMASSRQRKEAEGTPQKQLPTPTTPMT